MLVAVAVVLVDIQETVEMLYNQHQILLVLLVMMVKVVLVDQVVEV